MKNHLFFEFDKTGDEKKKAEDKLTKNTVYASGEYVHKDMTDLNEKLQEVTQNDNGLFLIKKNEENKYIKKVAIAGENEVGIKVGDTVLLNPNVNMIECKVEEKWYQLCPVSMVIAILK